MPKYIEQEAQKIWQSEPGIVKRWGEQMFEKVPLYPSKNKHRPVYINQDVFRRLFPEKAGFTLQQMADFLEAVFSTTIEPEKADGDALGFAYVDYQADPSDLSLSGNKGSGRAYYLGPFFNVKGERTPLATSKKRIYSDGYLEMERCVWECAVANGLQGSLSNGLNDVLAIIDMQEYCDVQWRDEPVQRGKIIRVDEAGELDRLSHYVFSKKSMQREDMEECAQSFGRLEADKISERLLHGAWSLGNISAKGHFIDLDTVSAVKGRAPIFSMTRWFIHNRFGFEHFGQQRILEMLCEDPAINTDGCVLPDLKSTMERTQEAHMARCLLALMGFKDAGRLADLYHEDIQSVLDMFIPLSRLFYDKQMECFNAKKMPSAIVHLYDLSFFMRFFALASYCADQALSVEDWVALMIENNALEEPFTNHEQPFSDIAQEHFEPLEEVLGEYRISNETQRDLTMIAAQEFVASCKALFEKIVSGQGYDEHATQEIALRAYRINEDRFYMMQHFTPTYTMAQILCQPLMQEDRLAQHCGMIDMLIAAHDRSLDKGQEQYLTDVRIYDIGATFNMMDMTRGTYQKAVQFWAKDMDKGSKLFIRTEAFGDIELQQAGTPQGVLYISESRPVKELLQGCKREFSLHISSDVLYMKKENQETIIEMVDLLDME